MADLSARPAAIRSTRPPRRTARVRVDNGMWHRPELLNLVSDLLTLLGAIGLGWALMLWFVSRPLFPLSEVVVLSPLAHVTEEQLEYAARTAVDGNSFTVDLETMKAAFEKLPWVRKAEVRRRWPDAIELHVEEHQAVAYWTVSDSGEARLVNAQGEVFVAASDAELPQFDGPQGSSSGLLARYGEFSTLLQPMGARLVGLALSARQAWQLRLDSGLVIMLGREQERSQLSDRLQRFIAAWPRVREQIDIDIKVADLRYPNGFALTPADGTVLLQSAPKGASKGKQ